MYCFVLKESAGLNSGHPFSFINLQCLVHVSEAVAVMGMKGSAAHRAEAYYHQNQVPEIKLEGKLRELIMFYLINMIFLYYDGKIWNFFLLLSMLGLEHDKCISCTTSTIHFLKTY